MRRRELRPEERDALLAIVNAAAEAYRGVIPADRWREPYMSGEYLRHEMEAGVVFWGYEADGVLVGVMGVGLLAAVTMYYFQILLTYVAPSFDFSSWYASFSLPALVVLVALALYAFRISLGNQPIFGTATLED